MPFRYYDITAASDSAETATLCISKPLRVYDITAAGSHLAETATLCICKTSPISLHV